MWGTTAGCERLRIKKAPVAVVLNPYGIELHQCSKTDGLYDGSPTLSCAIGVQLGTQRMLVEARRAARRPVLKVPAFRFTVLHTVARSRRVWARMLSPTGDSDTVVLSPTLC